MSTVLCRIPNHVGDCCMCLPALRLLEASGFTPALVGKRWAEDLMSGMGWRFDPIEGHVTEDINRIRYLADNAQATRGLLFPNSFGSALLFKFAPIQTAGLKTDCRSFLLDTKIPEPPKMHEVERFFYVAHEAIKAWGGKPAWDKAPKSLGLMLLKRHEAAARNLMEKFHIPERCYAILAPVARGLQDGKVKQWPSCCTSERDGCRTDYLSVTQGRRGRKKGLSGCHNFGTDLSRKFCCTRQTRSASDCQRFRCQPHCCSPRSQTNYACRRHRSLPHRSLEPPGRSAW